MGRQTGILKTEVPTKKQSFAAGTLAHRGKSGYYKRDAETCIDHPSRKGRKFSMERAEIISQILAILEDVAEVSPEDVSESSVLMDDLDLSSMEILTIVADLEETFGLRIPEKELRNFVTMGDLVDYLAANVG